MLGGHAIDKICQPGLFHQNPNPVNNLCISSTIGSDFYLGELKFWILDFLSHHFTEFFRFVLDQITGSLSATASVDFPLKNLFFRTRGSPSGHHWG